MSEARFQLHVITDGKRQANDLHAIVERAVKGGADVIQLRYKSAPALDLYTLAQAISPTIQAAGAGLLINDRVDVALAVEAQGVHLAAKSLPISSARPLLQPHQLVGCSVHSVEEAIQAEQTGASYITYGHIFATNSKPGLPPRGVDALRQVVEAVNIPVLAIGGITKDNLEEVLAVGVAGIAVIGAVMADEDPERASRELRDVMDNSVHRPKKALPSARSLASQAQGVTDGGVSR
ncbi:thiamine phosphate synthase [Tumebacillus flagellatus]|uniref:Thiamine-phosphate synthase n=1 Tax=Tumebacillus flagellatus TaxID=1157490 RepID=A0A074LKP9_9BACL|nr:thiamine phosphate synthase [Tumebacillus flagellatus]KEO81674.1 thiamine-phosphate diphosphorylase [Tumebacillus flagellatus]